MKKGYARKRDANEPEIIEALEAAGATVYRMDKPLDLIVGYQGRNYLLEVKRELVRGKVFKSYQRVTDEQKEFFDTWKGHATIVDSKQSALAAIGAA